MIISALFFAVLGTNQDFIVPPEASTEFRKLAISIEDALVEKNYEKGAKLIAQLPRSNATFRVDASKVPAAQRLNLASAIAGSAKMWGTALDGVASFTSSGASAGDIILTFGAASTPTWTWTPEATPAKLTASLPSTLSNVAEESKITFGKYLGLANVSKGLTLSSKDIQAAKKVLTLCRLLQDSIQSMAPDYNVPVGASTEFHHLVLDIEKALDGKDFAGAEQLSARLPRPKVTWYFDDSKLNRDQKEQFLQSVQQATEQWQRALNGQLAFERAPKGKSDITISFESVLAKLSGTKEVAGAAFFLAADSSKPQVEAVIGLKRGPKLEPLLAREVFNESLFAFGRFLGLVPNPQLGSAMGRIEGQMGNPNSVTQSDIATTRKIQTLANQLRTAIQKKQTLEFKQPILSLDRTILEFAPQFQGDEGRATILVTNTGSATLEVELRGDCGCISGEIQSTILPGKSAILTGIFTTVELSGDVHHNLILKSNDSDRPIIVIPCNITVSARAEIVYSGSNTAFLDLPGRTFTFYINSVESKIFKIIEANVMGMSLTAKAEPFEGEVSNFQRLGQKQMIRGYKVVVDTSNVPEAGVFGRTSVTAYLRTDNPKFGIIKAQVFIQKGIVCLPESVYLGSPLGVADSTFVVTRLGRPFTIKKISSDSNNLSFEIIPNAEPKPSAYTIRVLYDGKAVGHRLKGTITVETDDAKQPTIKLPFQTSQI